MHRYSTIYILLLLFGGSQQLLTTATGFACLFACLLALVLSNDGGSGAADLVRVRAQLVCPAISHSILAF